ncbi:MULTISPECIES: D-Ala-D-Ala carboxypeptidase family metallohydrolase [Fusobacterium]|uniref:D-Ala-D-Ala carboxypeptidase family metallohydrolase n=1 Tax=Fusobacterium TaxID=848 RepID=UPI001476A9D9|nr:MULTISPECIES: D-Ala-D-Ala carboxypeptidase family metallohydrolase [Fusobacterium]NME36069.1 hypothetical protein [Fusobacterium sp. FSA-380-WT-3A]
MKRFVYILMLLFLFTGCWNVKKRPNEKISEHFTYYEAVHSGYGSKKHIKNYPHRDDFRRIKKTAKRMEKIRKIVGEPIHINSWYRSGRINKRIGGSRTSAHTKGLAVDFTVDGNLWEAFNRIIRSGYSYDQIIYYRQKRYIHISFKEKVRDERKQRFYR